MKVWEALALVSGGLFTGAAFFVAVERIPIWARLDAEGYAADFRQSIRRADPLQPIMLMICAITTIAFATTIGGAARALALACVAILGVILVSSLALAEPMNSKFRRTEDGAIPPDTLVLRARWAAFHRIRTVAAVAAFACLAASASLA